ncbi:SigE family RNA polymerase sigma factor [Actinopolymorpha sp. B9G3]|uniref:SigE family RNA polymerase sigma factor n=1 Tax=Actinopolymorpha sp. B9G3 TaxID=3158970 RepID=UPI0032D97DBB
MSAGTRDAELTELCREHWVGLVRLAVLMVGDRASAEDAVQDAFAGLYRNWARLRDPAQAVTYLRSSVLNRSRSTLRRRRVALRHARLHEPPVWSAEHEAVLSEERREVLRALTKLPARRREVLVLRFYLDLKDAEIAEVLGISPGAVRTAASRGLASLGRILKGDR